MTDSDVPIENEEDLPVEQGNIVQVEVTYIADFGVFVRCKTE